MADADATDRHPAVVDVERIFSAFVRNANAIGKYARTARMSLPELERLPELDAEPVPLTRPKSQPPPKMDIEVQPSSDGPGDDTQKREAMRLVPNVDEVAPPEPPVPEGSEDGQMPAGELDRVLADMQVLLRYGHRSEVTRRLDELLARYPNDLLLLKRIAEFHLEAGEREQAIDRLFKLASALFERRNVHGMRQAIEQVRRIDRDNPRAAKLLKLLEQRSEQ